MSGLDVPNPDHVGRFRGEPLVQGVNVGVGMAAGVVSSEVLNELRIFDTTLQKVMRRLDELIPLGAILNEDAAAAVLELCGWTHAEWVRIHPFRNGNGRTARLFANYLAMRGIWEPTSMYFAELYLQQLKRPEDG
jgi:Fic family protein